MPVIGSKRRPLRLFAFAAASALAIAAACSFPEPTLVDPSEEGGADATVEEGGGGDASIDVEEPDSPPPIADATSEKPPLEAGCNPCDCDGDGFLLNDAAACPDDAGRARDCDDEDLRAFPDAGFRQEYCSSPTFCDWNCDKTVHREVTSVNVNCAAHSGLGAIAGCNGREGFTNDPACGDQGFYVKCEASGLDCREAAGTQVRTQGCR